MKIKDLQIEGFGVWTGLTVDQLPDGMTVFYGPNEAGKTTLMQFLRAMFYGFTQERRTRYLPPVHGGRPGGAMRVTGPGGGYEIARRAQLNDSGVHGQLTVTSSDGISQGQHRLSLLLGQIDESIFTNVFAIGLRELQELSTLDDTSAADELYKLSSGLDRVSLVDVIRQLRNARGHMVTTQSDAAQLSVLMLRREKLKDEMEQLLARGKRWAELAGQRRSYQTEIEDLQQRVAQWTQESRVLETAMQVREPWSERERIREAVKQLNARIDLPDDSLEKLKSINANIEERAQRILGIREQRQSLRDRVRQLPLRPEVVRLATKVEAAVEQSPWIAALQKQIVRLDADIQLAREQLIEDAKRLGLSEEDQQALLNDKRMANMPDLSRQAIAQLSGPARTIRSQLVLLQQAKAQAENDRREAEKLSTEIKEFLSARNADDLQKALQTRSDMIANLRKWQTIEERLASLNQHKKELEGEAVDLATEQAFPMERVFVLGIPFVFGGCMLVAGLFKTTGYGGWLAADAATGLMMMLIGIIVLFFWWTWRNYTEQGTEGDLTECENQLDATIRQIRRTEQELEELKRSLPEHTGTVEQRLREIEHEYAQIEGLVPLQHNYQAAMQRYHAARKRGTTAAEALRSARSQWQRSLQQLGLAESLSPKSIRIMAEGYESLLQTRRRLKTLEDELAQRKLEFADTTMRIEALERKVRAALRRESDEKQGGKREERAVRSDHSAQRRVDDRLPDARRQDERLALTRAVPTTNTSGTLPAVEQLEGCLKRIHELNSIIADQQTFIQQRKALKDEDENLAKQQKAVQKQLDKLELARQAMLADAAVENEEQLAAHLELKKQHFKFQAQIGELDQRIRAILGAQNSYEAVARMLESGAVADLERRWDGLQQKVQQSEQRISQLHQRQGETAQEMKTLAADRRLNEVKLELASLDKQIQTCTSHWQTLAATTRMLERVCEVYESERQPETLREASSFLRQLTEDKYIRVWTPLGKNALRIDNHQGQSLPLEVLSRGTREAVFIALRLSLAAAYARRGVMLPLVLDDVLVNFDAHRARSAAKVLRDFAELGHQVVMFTCHEHIMKMFHQIGVQVRVLPQQGQPGEALIYYPEADELQNLPPIHFEPEVATESEELDEEPTEFVAPPLVAEPVVEVVKPRSQPLRVEREMPEVLPEVHRLWYEEDPDDALASYVEEPSLDAEQVRTEYDPKIDEPWWQMSSAHSI